MSMGIGGTGKLVYSDEWLLIYHYAGWNLQHPDSYDHRHTLDGEIRIARSALVEPEIHKKQKRMPSGRRRMVVKRVQRDVPYEELLCSAQIVVRNASRALQTLEDGTDVAAFLLLHKVFEAYQDTGVIPEEVFFCK